jgi:hypothetical protein
MTFPCAEGISAGIISALNNAGGLVLLVVMPLIDKNWDSLLMALTVVVTFVMVLTVDENYERSKHDMVD